MNTMSQGEAVFQAVSKVFEVNGAAVPPTGEWTESQKSQVNSLVFNFFKTGATSHKGNPSDEQLLKYIPGLVNNWVRKDKRLNGGQKYETKRPGSRTGSGDEMLKNLRILLSVTADPAAKQQIEAAITARVAELKPKVEVNVAALPENLRHLVPTI